MRISLLVLLLTISFPLFSQQITGIAKDEAGKPVSNATILLIRTFDSSTIKMAVSMTDGRYSFHGIKEGNYKVVASYAGTVQVSSQVFSFNSKDMIVPDLELVRLAGNLGGVTITSRKPMVEVKADKMIVNVEGIINSTGSNVLELLRKSPGIVMDKDDNMSLAGKNGVQVYIDGRSTPLSGQDLAIQLKSMQSSQVESIELITNPSAKYDAAGNAGIINIRLIRNKSLGTNGTVNAGWNMGITSKYNAGLALNYRNKSINLFSNYNYSFAPNEQSISSQRFILDSFFNQQGKITDRRKSHNVRLGGDYFINKKNTIGFLANAILSDPASATESSTLISSRSNNIVDRILVAGNNNNMKRHNANLNLNYNYNDGKGVSFVLNADRGSYDLNSDQVQGNYYYDKTGQTSLGNVIYHMISPAIIKINSVKADYEQNLLKGKLSAGTKMAWVRTDNNFQRNNVFSSGEVADKERSNHFFYDENIKAGYVNYQRQFKGFMIQGGVRAENTTSEGISEGLKYNGSGYVPSISDFSRSYTDIFPSAAVTFNKNPKKVWNLSFSRRIDRPAYQDLNPFEFRLDEYTYMKGNVNLRPQYTNSILLTHSYQYKLNISLGYSHVSDLFTQIFDTVDKSRAFISKRNLATQDVFNFNISYPFQFKSLSLFSNISSNYSRYHADFGQGRKIDLNAVGFNVFLQSSIKFQKTWTAELSGFYNAPTIYMGTFKGRSIYSLDAGLSKQVLNGKGTIKASVSDIFRSMRFHATSDFAGQTMSFDYRQESRQLKINFSYRFGNSGVKPARQRTSGAEEELKRTQSAGGMIGGN